MSKLNMKNTEGRFGATGSASDPDPVHREARDVLLDEVYALIQGLIADRDTLSVEQQLDTLSVQLGSAIATASYSDIHRERLLKRAKGRMRHSCDATARFLAPKGGV